MKSYTIVKEINSTTTIKQINETTTVKEINATLVEIEIFYEGNPPKDMIIKEVKVIYIFDEELDDWIAIDDNELDQYVIDTVDFTDSYEYRMS